MLAYQCFFLSLLLAAASAKPHFDKTKYEIKLTDCRAPQSDLAVIRLLGANTTHRVIWNHGYPTKAISLDAQQFNASDSSVVVRPAYPDSCPLQYAYQHYCQRIYASSDGHNHLATSQLCLNVTCQTRGTLHWPQPTVHFDVPDCRIGQLIGRTTAVGGIGSYKYKCYNEKINTQCVNSSAVLNIKRYLGTFSGKFFFRLAAANSQPHDGETWVKTTAIAHVHCNVTTEAPRFDHRQFNMTLHHCLPNKTRPIGRVTVTGGEAPINYTLTGRSRSSCFHLNATTGELFLAELLNPYWYARNPSKDLAVRAVDAVGRSAKTTVLVDESCDQDPPVRFKKLSYEFQFTNCSSNATDEAVGRVEAAGNSSYHYHFQAAVNRCQMIEVKLNTGYVTFGPALCHREPIACCKRGQVYAGSVSLVDTRTGRPARKLAQLKVTNTCSFSD